jgi:hypothetical protein
MRVAPGARPTAGLLHLKSDRFEPFDDERLG